MRYASQGLTVVVHSITTPIDDHYVEVFAPVVVPSPSRPTSSWRAKSPGDTKAPIKTRIDGHHVEVSAIVIVPSSSRHTSLQLFRLPLLNLVMTISLLKIGLSPNFGLILLRWRSMPVILGKK